MPEGAGRNGSKFPVTLDEDGRKAFDALVEHMCSPPVLGLAVTGRPFELDTDASDEQIGVALYQRGEDRKRRPIGYWSRQMSDDPLLSDGEGVPGPSLGGAYASNLSVAN